MTNDPLQGLPPGRRVYEQARRLRIARRRYWLMRVIRTAVR